MDHWDIQETDKFARDKKRYFKKQKNELIATLNNLETYYRTLQKLGNPLQVKAGFIHVEPNGIKAIDQSGSEEVLGKKIKLRQTRLYVYPETDTKILHLLKIGDKNSQEDDIKLCRDYVKDIRGE